MCLCKGLASPWGSSHLSSFSLANIIIIDAHILYTSLSMKCWYIITVINNIFENLKCNEQLIFTGLCLKVGEGSSYVHNSVVYLLIPCWDIQVPYCCWSSKTYFLIENLKSCNWLDSIGNLSFTFSIWLH